MIKYETFIARNFPDLCTVYMKSYSKLTFGTTFGLTFGLTLEMKSVLELEQQSVALQLPAAYELLYCLLRVIPGSHS